MSTIYESWKPLRNYLGKIDAKEALEVLRYYSLYPGDPSKLPPNPPDYIEVHPSIFQQNNGIYPWDISTLAREVIYSSGDSVYARYKLREWRGFSRALNHLKDIEETIAQNDLNPNNILRELFRLGHREFAHQMGGLTRSSMVRYGLIFSNPELVPIVERRTGLSMQKILTIGLGIWGLYNHYAAVSKPTEGWPSLGITLDEIETFFRIFSKPFGELKQIVRNNHTTDNTFFYQYNPLAAYPLVEFSRYGETTYVCPSIHNFQTRITSGVYYELYMDPYFDNPYGNAYQHYIGQVSNASLRDVNSTNLYGEETDPSPHKRRCDWVIDQSSSFTLVECKTKRIAIPGYTIIDTDTTLKEQLNILADAVVQTYEALLMYESGRYSPPIYRYDTAKKPSICVVTLEQWHLFGPQLSMLRDIVLGKLASSGIDVSIVERAPYITIDTDEYEHLLYLARRHSLTDLISDYADPSQQYHTWEFTSYLRSVAGEELTNYEYALTDQFNSLFTSEINTAFTEEDRHRL